MSSGTASGTACCRGTQDGSVRTGCRAVCATVSSNGRAQWHRTQAVPHESSEAEDVDSVMEQRSGNSMSHAPELLSDNSATSRTDPNRVTAQLYTTDTGRAGHPLRVQAPRSRPRMTVA